MSVTFHDIFCGAGGTALGAYQAGAVPVIGMNHWLTACTSWETNHGHTGARAACVDVVTQDPRRYPTADLLLASPECTHHSYARGKPKDDPSLFDPDGNKGAERSRATMWDVVRFAEVHQYAAIIVENVEAAVKWGLPKGAKLKHGEYGPLFAAWLQALEGIGYRYRLVHLNSLVCGVPQSRDRLYVVFWLKTQRAPDLDIPAAGWCGACAGMRVGYQVWKKPGGTYGLLGQQYYYGCQDCGGELALAVRPAAAAIDWDMPAVKIGDRAKPLKPATIKRIARGLAKLRDRPRTIRFHNGLVVQVGANTFEREGYSRAWPLSDVMPAICGTGDRAVVLPTTHDDSSDRTRVAGQDPLPTLTSAHRGELAMVVSNMTNNVPRDAAGEPMHALTSGEKEAVVVSIRGGANDDREPSRADDEPMRALSAQGTHHAVVVSVRGPADQPRPGRDPDAEPLNTIAATCPTDAIVVTHRGDPDRPGGGNEGGPAADAPLDSITGQGTHHSVVEAHDALVIANYGSPGGPSSQQGWARHADDGVLGTLTATDSHALFNYRDGQGIRPPEQPLDAVATHGQQALVGDITEEEIADCTFRMLGTSELKIGHGFTLDYILHGLKGDQIAQIGNAVTAPVARELTRRVIESLS